MNQQDHDKLFAAVQTLWREYCDLKADNEALRKIVDVLADATDVVDELATRAPWETVRTLGPRVELRWRCGFCLALADEDDDSVHEPSCLYIRAVNVLAKAGIWPHAPTDRGVL